MTHFEIPHHIVFKELGSAEAPHFNLPVLPDDHRRMADSWQILLHDMDDGRLWFTKWSEDSSLEGIASPLEATQFDLRLGVLAGIHKAAELRKTQYNPDKLYIVNADRTTIAQILPEPA